MFCYTLELRTTKVKGKTSKPQKHGRNKNCEILKEKVPSKSTLLNYLMPDRSSIDRAPTDSNLTLPNENYLNLSGIIEDIVTRPNSNPAISRLSKLI